MFFGVFDLTFVVWMIIGAAGVFIIAGANQWFKDKGIAMTWWKWTLLVVWYVVAMIAWAAPFTIMGESEVAAGWRMLLFSIPFIIISGFVVYRILKLGSSKQEA